MGWDELSAIGSIGATLVILVGSIAAVVQLKHLRLSNQMETYLDLMRQLNSPEMIEAREYAESHDFEDPEVLRKAFEGGLDHRILFVGGFYQVVARLINLGILDKELFAPINMSAPRVWRSIKPVAYELRARSPENPRWTDLEYLVYSQQRPPLSLRRYSPEFRQRVGLERALSEWSRQLAVAKAKDFPEAEA